MIGATIVSSSYDNAVYKDSLSPLNLSPANSTTVEGIQPHMLVGNPAYSADAGTLPTPSEEHHTPQPSTSALEMETSHTAESGGQSMLENVSSASSYLGGTLELR